MGGGPQEACFGMQLLAGPAPVFEQQHRDGLGRALLCDVKWCAALQARCSEVVGAGTARGGEEGRASTREREGRDDGGKWKRVKEDGDQEMGRLMEWHGRERTGAWGRMETTIWGIGTTGQVGKGG